MFARMISALFLASMLALPAMAQENTAAIDSLHSHFQRQLSRAERLNLSQRNLSGEDSLVIAQEVEAAVVAAAATLDELSRELVMGADSEAAHLLPPSIAADFVELESKLWGAEASIRARLARTRNALFPSEGAARESLERELAVRERRLDLVYELLAAHLAAMQRLDLDDEPGWDRLVALVTARADLLSGRIRLLDTDIRQMSERAEAHPDDAALAQQIEFALRRGELYVESLTAGVAMLSAQGQETAGYTNLLVQHTGDITRGLMNLAVTKTIMEDWVDTVAAWIAANGLPLALKALVFLIIMALSFGVAQVVRKAVERALAGPHVRVSNLLRRMLIAMGGRLVMLTGFMIALSQIGVNLAPILAGVGVVGFIVGFALQDSLANFAAGVMILFYRPYDVGDLVEVSGVFGTVNNMSLVSTTILTIDNQTLVVPNGKIWGDVIRNVTAQQMRRVDLVFGISYSDDIPKAEGILMSILENHEMVLSDPEPMVRLYKLNDSSVDFVVRPWVKTDDYWDVFWDVTREVKMRFDAEEISIPFPQRDVHHFVAGAPAVAAPADPRAAHPAGQELAHQSRTAAGIAADGDAEIGEAEEG